MSSPLCANRLGTLLPKVEHSEVIDVDQICSLGVYIHSVDVPVLTLGSDTLMNGELRSIASVVVSAA